MTDSIQLPYHAPPEELPSEIPSKDAIESSKNVLCEQSARKVVGVGSHFIVKYGLQIDLEEGLNMIFMKNTTSVSVPKVYALFKDIESNRNYIIMERISGDCLDSIWTSLDHTQKQAITLQIRESFPELRKIRSPDGCCSLDGQSLDLNGPFKTETDLNNALIMKYLSSGYLPVGKADYYRRALPSISKGHPPTFTNGDLQRKNIIVGKDGSITIIDWESAGWYPSYWEYARAIFACGRFDDDWSEWIDFGLDVYRNEYAWMQMLITNQEVCRCGRHASREKPAARILRRADNKKDPRATVKELQAHWHNPKEVIAVLLIISGEIVQKALAQLSAGRGYIVPVTFSFGWVAYAFSTIVSLVGDCRLMPEPDCCCKVLDVENGVARENQSWVLGRLLRDSEPLLDRQSLRIDVFTTRKARNKMPAAGTPKWGWSFPLGLGVTIVQLVVAAIPCFLYYDWGILLITCAGMLLAIFTGLLPQWKAEKYGCRTNIHKVVAITAGNVSRYVMVVFGRGSRLEDLAAGEGPRMKRPWEKRGLFTKKILVPPPFISFPRSPPASLSERYTRSRK